eukprot:gene4849-6044_t
MDPSIGLLSRLKYLNLENNQLEDLPDTIGSLNSLIHLNVSSNLIKSLPSSLSHVKSLRRINLQHNPIPNINSLSVLTHMNSLKSLEFQEDLVVDHPFYCHCRFCSYLRFDQERFEEIIDKDPDFEKELINLFNSCMQSDLLQLNEGLTEKCYNRIYFVSHKIKGALVNIGALQMIKYCSILENFSRSSQNIEECFKAFNNLKVEFYMISKLLNSRISINTNDKTNNILKNSELICG